VIRCVFRFGNAEVMMIGKAFAIRSCRVAHERFEVSVCYMGKILGSADRHL
jgi:hypothetical protein